MNILHIDRNSHDFEYKLQEMHDSKKTSMSADIHAAGLAH